MTEHDDAAAASLPVAALEEQVVFSEWRTLRQGSSRSLSRTQALMKQLGYSPGDVGHRTVGVVGSKGKGTASAYASAAAASGGGRVVTVMSPGVLSNADRIRVGGAPVGEDLRRSALLKIRQARQLLPKATESSGYLAPTGLFLLMGFLIAREVDADIVVAEAGIGGASDDLSHWPLDGVIVTGIFGEHLDLLGPAVEDVVQDKSAVITPHTQWVVACPQTPSVQAIIEQRCREVGARFMTPSGVAGPWISPVVSHLPPGFAQENAAAGVTAGVAISRSPLTDAAEFAVSDAELHQLAAVAQSVRYPGRLSVHEVPVGAGDPAAACPAGTSPVRHCVVDSAVSRSGLQAALTCAAGALDGTAQVLVCLPPSKDLQGFVSELQGFSGSKIFIEMPGAYIGTPERRDWPSGPGWEWVRLDDLGTGGAHQSAASATLLDLLHRGDSLAVGTVLFTSLTLRTLGADAAQLFTAAE